MKNASLCLLALALALPAASWAGNEGNIWYFPNLAGVDFNSGMPVALTDGQITTPEGCASIADEFGSLLFYTNGITVWDRNHAVMATGLFGNPSSTHSAIIVPVLNSSTEYYIITADALNGPNGIAYSIVDITANGGLGAVTTLNQPVMPGVQSEKLAVARHANGTDLWLLSGNVQNEYLAFPITPGGGVSMTPVVSVVANSRPAVRDAGYMRVSPDDSKVAAVYFQEDWVELLDFDNSTGQYTLLEMWQLGGAPNSTYGTEFSPNSSLLYVSEAIGNTVVQYDLSASPVSASGTVLATLMNFPSAISVAPDGKLYVGKFQAMTLDAIDQPNVLGAGAGYVMDAVDLGGAITTGSLPTIPQFLAGPTPPEPNTIEIPTVSEWGLLVLSLLLAVIGTVILAKRVYV